MPVKRRTPQPRLDRGIVEEIVSEIRMRGARNVVRIRKTLGLTQGDLAAICDCTAQYIGQVEAGRTVPSHVMRLILADALGRDVEDIWPTPTSAELHARATLNLVHAA